jgi:hypothetical protein
MLDWVQETTDPAQTAGKNNNIQGSSCVSTSA